MFSRKRFVIQSDVPRKTGDLHVSAMTIGRTCYTREGYGNAPKRGLCILALPKFPLRAVLATNLAVVSCGTFPWHCFWPAVLDRPICILDDAFYRPLGFRFITP